MGGFCYYYGMEDLPQADFETPQADPSTERRLEPAPAERLARMSDVLGPKLMRMYAEEDASAEATARQASARLRHRRR